MQNRLLLFCAALLLHMGLSAHLLLNPTTNCDKASSTNDAIMLLQYLNNYKIQNNQLVFQQKTTSAISSSNVYVLDSDQSVEECSGTLFDSGGQDGPYSNNESHTFTITNPTGLPVELVLTFFETEGSFDFVRLYDGLDTDSPLIIELDGTHTGESYSSTENVITIEFSSDGSVTRPGFEITWGEGQGNGPADASVTASTTTAFISQPIVFTPVSENSQELLYDFGDETGLIVGNGSTTHSYIAAGVYTVMTIDNNCTEQDTTFTTVEVVEGTTFEVAPSSIADTLATDEMSSHQLVVTNTGSNPGYVGATLTNSSGVTFFTASGDALDGIELQAGESTTLLVNLDATGLFPALYEDIIRLSLSDDSQATNDFSVKLRVTGVATAEYSTTSLNFGQLFVGQTAVEELTISSTGTDSLFITSATFNDDRFEIAQDIPFGIAATKDSTIQINFLSSDAPGLIFGRVTVETNAGSQNINFIAEIVDTPIATLTPDSICVTLNAGSSLDTSLLLVNSGLTALTYQFTDNIIDSSLMVFTNEDSTTTHSFQNLPPLPYNAALEIRLQGDFGRGNEYVSININGTDYGIVSDNNINADVLDVIYFPLPPELLDAGNLEIVLANSDAVFPFSFYENRHEIFLVTAGHDWLSFNEDTTLLGPNTETTFPLTIDASNLYGGQYLAHVVFNSNDPQLEVKPVPVKLTVIGIPELELDREAVDFGDVLLTTTSSQTVNISNPGSEALVIESVTFGNNQYTANETSFTVAPETSKAIEISFAPTAVGNANTEMSLSGPTHQATVTISGSGVAIPNANFSRDTICVTLEQGQSTSEQFTISNSGEGNLVYDAGLGGTGNRVLVWSRVAPDNSYDNMMEILTNPELLLDVSVTSTNDSLEMAELLANNDILVFHNMSFIPSSITNVVGPAILSWVEQGGRVITAGNGFSSISENMNLHDGNFHGIFDGGVDGLEIIDENHPLLEGVSLPIDLAGGMSYVNAITASDDVTIIARSAFDENQGLMFTQTQQEGEVIFLGFDYGELTESNTTVLRNALAYAQPELPLPAWLSVDNTNGTISPNNASDVNLSFNTADLEGGVYSFPLSYSVNQPGNELNLVIAKMNIITAPVAAFSSINETSCNGDVLFMDESLQSPTSWEWSFGDGNSSTEQNPAHTYASSGQYTVSLTVCNELGCNTTTVENFITVDLENPFCLETSFEPNTFTQLNGCGGVIYSPGFEDGAYPNSVNGAEILITSGNGGPIRISVISFSLETCCDYFTAYDGADASAPELGRWNGTQLTEEDEILSTGDAIFLTFSSDGSVTRPGFEMRWQCAQAVDNVVLVSEQEPGCPATYSFEAQNGVDFYAYNWDFGDGTTATGSDLIEHTYAERGTYTVSLEINDETDTRVIQREVVIQALNLPLSIDGPDTVLINESATFTKNGTDLLDSFSWSEETGNTSTGESFTTSWSEAGTYQVRLDAGSSEVCAAAAVKSVVVVDPVNTNDTEEVSGLRLFPNPAGQVLNFELQLNEINSVQYAVVDALGRQVIQQPLTNLPNSGIVSVEIGQLPSATYLLVITDSSGRRLATRRFMKR